MKKSAKISLPEVEDAGSRVSEKRGGGVACERDGSRFISVSNVAGIAAPACFYAWMLLTSFTSVLYMGDFGTGLIGVYSMQRLVLAAGYLAAVALRIIRPGRIAAASPHAIIGWGIIGAFGTLAVVAAYMLPISPVLIGILVIAAFAAGFFTALIQVQWIAQYATHGSDRAIWEWPCVMVLSALTTGIVLLLPFVACIIIVALLPLVASLFVAQCGIVLEMPEESGDDGTENLLCRSLPWGLSFGIVAIGGVYGLTQHFAFDYAGLASGVAVSSIAAAALLGLLFLAYAASTRRNFGFSPLTIAIVPLAGFAQCLVAVHQSNWVLASSFFMCAAFLSFDAILWMQFPLVYARLRTLKSFLRTRLLLQGSEAVGFAIQMVLALTGFQYFNIIALCCVVLLLASLSIAFSSDSVGTVWNLMPLKTQHVGKFRRACKEIDREYHLTRRESEILELVMRGRSGPYVQDKLVISKNTYQTHMRNIYTKIDVHSQQDLLTLLENIMSEQRNQEP